jgi:predicted kinase
MRRFDETATLATRLDEIDGAFAERLGREIGRFHTAASAGRAGGGARGIDYVLRSYARLLSGETAELGAAEVERLISSADAAFSALAALLDRRAAEGFVRCCHGDLHLGNILLEHGAPVLFDCLEFNDTLREIDVLYDIAFLLMDLSFRGAHEAANRVLNGWLDQAARAFGPRFWEGAAALALFQSARAAVRAHVNVLEKRHDEARAYLAAAQDYLEPRPPVLVAVGGLSGSGKTTLARALAPALGRRPGAIVLRSDEVRKRLWGVGPTDRLPTEAYTPEAGAIVYDALFTTASTCLAAGSAVIVDAVFLKPEERRGIGTLAAERRARFQGVWLDAPAETLRDRLRRRRGDASDADERVLDIQLAQDAGAIDWPRHPGAGSPAGLAALQEWLR